jgi:hypothetical protein
MKIFIDTEFEPQVGQAPKLISIGAVMANGTEFYGENGDYDLTRPDIDPWLHENVFPHLSGPVYSEKLLLDKFLDFVGSNEELYFWVGTYDWFMLWDLFTKYQVWDYRGAKRIPQRYYRDLKHLWNWMCPEYDLPDNDTGAVHNALADAKWNKKVYDRLVEVAGPYVNFEL